MKKESFVLISFICISSQNSLSLWCISNVHLLHDVDLYILIRNFSQNWDFKERGKSFFNFESRPSSQ